jgi:hypothetical protein
VGLHLADLGAEVIKVESPQGDYVRQMTWPIIEGSSLLHWHINRGKGRERTCSEVIWNAEHWHSLVENLFMTATDDPHGFELFASESGLWINHKRLAEHIREGSADLAELRRKATKTRKPRFRRDHFWDSFAMMLVARSVETRLREIESTRRTTRTLAEMAAGK